MSKDTVDQPAQVPQIEPGRQAPVQQAARSLRRALRHPAVVQGLTDMPACPPGEAQQEDHAQDEADDAVGIKDIQIHVVRVADGYGIMGRDKPQCPEAGIVAVKARPQPGMLKENLPAQGPEAPASVPRDGGRIHAMEGKKGEAPQHQHAAPEGDASRPAARQKGPEDEGRSHGKDAAAAGGAFQQEKGRDKEQYPDDRRGPDAQTATQKEPAGKGRDHGQCHVIAHAVVPQAAGQASGVGRIAHDQVEAGPGLPHAVQPLPDTGQHTRPDKAAQIPGGAHALHGDKGQDIGLVDAHAPMQEGLPDICGEDHADEGHGTGTEEERPDREAAQDGAVPGVLVVEQQKNETKRRCHFTPAVAYGEQGQGDPERPEKTGMPEFPGVSVMASPDTVHHIRDAVLYARHRDLL